MSAGRPFCADEQLTLYHGDALAVLRRPGSTCSRCSPCFRALDNPSQLMKALLREGLDRAAAASGRVVTVRVDDLHRAIDSVTRAAA